MTTTKLLSERDMNSTICEVLKPFIRMIWSEHHGDNPVTFDPLLYVGDDRIWLAFENGASNICPVSWWRDSAFDLAAAVKEAMARHDRK